ncbi:unnamed protein product, partial [Ectocarpus sp. 4 AP-2014]
GRDCCSRGKSIRDLSAVYATRIHACTEDSPCVVVKRVSCLVELKVVWLAVSVHGAITRCTAFDSLTLCPRVFSVSPTLYVLDPNHPSTIIILKRTLQTAADGMTAPSVLFSDYSTNLNLTSQ